MPKCYCNNIKFNLLIYIVLINNKLFLNCMFFFYYLTFNHHLTCHLQSLQTKIVMQLFLNWYSPGPITNNQSYEIISPNILSAKHCRVYIQIFVEVGICPSCTDYPIFELVCDLQISISCLLRYSLAWKV